MPLARCIIYNNKNANQTNTLLQRIDRQENPINNGRFCNFVMLTKIKSTSFAFIPFGNDQKPIPCPNYECNIKNYEDYISKEKDCQYIDFRPLHPVCLNIGYSPNLTERLYNNSNFDSSFESIHVNILFD